ncbi:MAG: hypothetical protein LUQ25_04870 [Methanoregulaceae archaeon]|nr:hypothetical protein [Methanoregulaceae archaeon]
MIAVPGEKLECLKLEYMDNADSYRIFVKGSGILFWFLGVFPDYDRCPLINPSPKKPGLLQILQLRGGYTYFTAPGKLPLV